VALAKKIEQNPFRRDLPPAVTRQSIWPWLVVLGACLFWADVFVRRVQVNLEWLWLALARLRDYILRREHAAPVPETMSRLRSRKAQIDEQIEGRRAAARFEISDPTAGAAPPPVEGGAAPVAEKPRPAEESKPEQPAPESYTERLLKAKKQVWRERDEEK
jgi:hypothetical protein